MIAWHRKTLVHDIRARRVRVLAMGMQVEVVVAYSEQDDECEHR